MIKNPSETKSDLTCEECGEPIKQNQTGNKPIYCEFCGALNNTVYTQKQETLVKRRRQGPKSQLEQKEIRFSYTTEELRQEIRNLTYQKIYELVKTTFSVMRQLKHQEDLKQSQILKLAKKLRKALLSLSLPSDSAELLTKTSKKKIENYFEKFQSGLKKKKKSQSNYMPYFIKNIKFVFRLINGDYEFSNLTKYNQKAVKKLKEKYGFKINAKTKNSFSYSLSILMCRKTYRIITAPGHVLDLKHSKNELTKQYTLNTAKDITVLVLNNYFKRNFSKSYKKLKKDLEIDWVYRESFIEYVCSLIKLVYKLAYNNGYSSRLRGFQKLIAEDLKESAFFENDTNYSPYLRLNLTLILSRIIHYVLDSSLNLTPLQSDPRKLNPTDNLRFANEIVDEILADKKIKSEFLKKFYNLSLEEFQKKYEKLQAKLKSDMLYKENFLSFLQKLINSVYKITHTRSKKSNHSKIELGIIKDLANYNFNWELIKKEKSCFYSEEKDKRNDIFTTEIPENSLLWRVRAYVIGFLLADGFMKTKRSYVISISQHFQDIDILKNVKKTIGGKISGPYDDIYYLNAYGKKLIGKIRELGMVECHTKKDIANKILPPNFISRKIDNITLIRDFVRGFFDGDGTFSGSFKDRSVRFGLSGPEKFLRAIQNLITNEISDITTFITKETIRYFIIDDKKYLLYSKLRIYKKGEGFYKLKPKDLEKGIIIKAKHPWLKRLHISGSLNCIKFFNWLYEDNDHFHDLEINGIKICGKRKFLKCLETLGNKKSRKERLAPNWSDIIPDIIIDLDNKYYKSDELMKILNDELLKKLTNLRLGYLYNQKKAKNLDVFRNRLKYFEYQDDLLGSFQKRIGSSNTNFYYSKLNPPREKIYKSQRKIELIDRKGSLKKNLKNLIIYFLLVNDNNFLNFEDLRLNLIKSNVFSKSTLRTNRIKLDLLELASFDIIIIDENEIGDNLFLVNTLILPKFYNVRLKELKDLLFNLFNSDK